MPRGELTRGIEVVEFACGIPHLLKGEHSMNVGGGVDSYSEYSPLGVLPASRRSISRAWCRCGCSRSPSPAATPSCSSPPNAIRRRRLMLARLLKQAGLPDGVFNVVHGDKEAVDTLLDDPRVHAVSFVGSTPIAEYIYARGSANGKRVQALGGAKNHMVVMPDADMDQAAERLARRRLRLGRRALHGDLGRGLRWRRDGRRADRETQADGAKACASAPVTTAIPTWARWSPASTATRCRATWTSAWPRAQSWWWMDAA